MLSKKSNLLECLNNLLSNQKENVGKEGLGFVPKSKKKNNNKKKKTKPTPPSNGISFVKEGEKAIVKEKDEVVSSEGVFLCVFLCVHLRALALPEPPASIGPN